MWLGESAALTAALLWTISSIVWGQIQLSAMMLNLCKTCVAVVFVCIHIVLLSLIGGDPLFSAPLTSWGWLAISGVLGILIGDALFFRSLQILGPRRSLMVMTTTPLFAAAIGWVVLGETLEQTATYGMVLTITGVLMVVLDRRANQESPGLLPGNATLGVVYGLLGAACSGAGGVLSRKGMVSPETGEEICRPIEAAFIRILVAAIGTVIAVAVTGQLKKNVVAAMTWEKLRLILPATALGTWLGIWLSQVAFGHSPAAIAQTLLSTCPLFAIPIVWFYWKHQVTVLAVVGTIIGVIGIYLTTVSPN